LLEGALRQLVRRLDSRSTGKGQLLAVEHRHGTGQEELDQREQGTHLGSVFLQTVEK
jgi:hypothetical protein